MIYTFDVSFVSALVIPDEKNPRIEKIRASINESDGVFVPQLFWYEIANIFQNLSRRKRYSYNEVLQFFPFVAAIKLTTDHEKGIAYTQKLLSLCNTYNLSSYDAAYLELADRKNAMLCTLDKGLCAAAKKHGIAILK